MELFKKKSFIIILFIVIFFPALINLLVISWRSPITFGDTNSWIGFFSSYYGAIFGGVISGLFTYLGVGLSLKKDQNDKFIEHYPNKMENLVKLQKLIDTFLKSDIIKRQESDFNSFYNDLFKICYQLNGVFIYKAEIFKEKIIDFNTNMRKDNDFNELNLEKKDDLGRPILTEKAINKRKEYQIGVELLFDDITNYIELYKNDLTNKIKRLNN